jgi:hypothetical protein
MSRHKLNDSFRSTVCPSSGIILFKLLLRIAVPGLSDDPIPQPAAEVQPQPGQDADTATESKTHKIKRPSCPAAMRAIHSGLPMRDFRLEAFEFPGINYEPNDPKCKSENVKQVITSVFVTTSRKS